MCFEYVPNCTRLSVIKFLRNNKIQHKNMPYKKNNVCCASGMDSLLKAETATFLLEENEVTDSHSHAAESFTKLKYYYPTGNLLTSLCWRDYCPFRVLLANRIK